MSGHEDVGVVEHTVEVGDGTRAVCIVKDTKRAGPSQWYLVPIVSMRAPQTLCQVSDPRELPYRFATISLSAFLLPEITGNGIMTIPARPYAPPPLPSLGRGPGRTFLFAFPVNSYPALIVAGISQGAALSGGILPHITHAARNSRDFVRRSMMSLP